jgi:membrane-associated phospholipid phosphatase
MARGSIALLMIIVLTVCLWFIAAQVAYFPGDVPVARFLQTIAPAGPQWAKVVTATAEFPWFFILLAITFTLAWSLSGRRAALVSVVSFAGMWLLAEVSKLLLFQPRPSPKLINVVDPSSGSAFPSTFALIYAATFGYLIVLAALRNPRTAEWIILIISCLLLFIGGVARIVLGAHWPSDIILSYLAGFIWAALLIRLVPSERH